MSGKFRFADDTFDENGQIDPSRCVECRAWIDGMDGPADDAEAGNQWRLLQAQHLLHSTVERAETE